MRKKNSIKCGEYWMKDGVIIKRPGKAFRVPSMPDKYKMPYPKYDTTSCLVFFASIVAHENACDDIDEMNALKEKRWQNTLKRQHNAMTSLYHISRVKKTARCVVRRARQGFSRLLDAVIREYGE